jgi:hypothetical protein
LPHENLIETFLTFLKIRDKKGEKMRKKIEMKKGGK